MHSSPPGAGTTRASPPVEIKARAIVAMATNLGLVTIAEGVETEAERKFLLQTGCAEGQGYLYSRPLPPGEIVRVLRSQQQRAEPQLELVASPSP